MTRKYLYVFCVMLVFSRTVSAQEPTREVFAGYSYEKYSGADTGLNGLNFSLMGRMAPHFYIGSEVTYHSQDLLIVSGSTVVNGAIREIGYRGGVAARWGSGRIHSFAHGMFGGSWFRIKGSVRTGTIVQSESDSSSTYSLSAGTGLDVTITKEFAIRPAQIDYIRHGDTLFFGTSLGVADGLRYSGGVVFRF